MTDSVAALGSGTAGRLRERVTRARVRSPRFAESPRPQRRIAIEQSPLRRIVLVRELRSPPLTPLRAAPLAYRSFLNDINGFHVTPADAWRAIETAAQGPAAQGPVAEGNVSGGTGMVCFGFKGGTGSASRVLSASDGGYPVGVLVQCNTGSAHELRIAGVPVGQILHQDRVAALPYGANHADTGSIIIVIATNAPLTATQLDRLCRRATLGLRRVGGPRATRPEICFYLSQRRIRVPTLLPGRSRRARRNPLHGRP